MDLPLPKLPHIREPLSSDHPRVSCHLLRVLCRLPCGPHTCTLLRRLAAEAAGLQQKGLCRKFFTSLVIIFMCVCVCMSVWPVSNFSLTFWEHLLFPEEDWHKDPFLLFSHFWPEFSYYVIHIKYEIRFKWTQQFTKVFTCLQTRRLLMLFLVYASPSRRRRCLRFSAEPSLKICNSASRECIAL